MLKNVEGLEKQVGGNQDDKAKDVEGLEGQAGGNDEGAPQ
jgi:hypothetical protein